MPTFAVVDPASEQTITELPDAGVDEALAAVAAAAGAQRAWAATPPRVRADILHRAYRELAGNDELAALIVRENGKPIAEARAEVAYAAEFVRWYAEEAVRISGTVAKATASDATMLVLRQPVGVALLVTPWNLPAAMVTRKVAPALAAGCTAVLKPAAETPLTALAIAEVFARAGVPAGVLHVVTTTKAAEVVAACLDDHNVRKLSFTGSTEVGRALLARAATRVVNCSMELGGNAPFIVYDDADLSVVVPAAIVAKMRHNAEACTAANRFYVHAAIEREFTDALSVAMETLRVGPGTDPDVDVGPLVDASARDKVERLVDDAVAAGARVRIGAKRCKGSGFFYEPTVLDDVAPDNPILRDEIFGPVAPVVRFDTDDEVLALANDTEHGLLSYVFTRDLARGLRTAEALESGMVAINRAVVSDAAAPFGGVKQSGLGREGGSEGIAEYLETKYVALEW